METSKLVNNEQTKLLATFYNNLSVLSVATGLVVPIISLSTTERPALAVWLPAGFGAVFCLVFFTLAQNALKALKE